MYEMGIIGARAFNVCGSNDLNTLEDICCFAFHNGMDNSFLKLRNCGKKTVTELIGVVKEFSLLFQDVTDGRYKFTVTSIPGNLRVLFDEAYAKNIDEISNEEDKLAFCAVFSDAVELIGMTLFDPLCVFRKDESLTINQAIFVYETAIGILDSFRVLARKCKNANWEAKLSIIVDSINQDRYYQRICLMLNYLNPEKEDIIIQEFEKIKKGLSVRATHALSRADMNYRSILKVVTGTSTELKGVYSCGKKTMKEINDLFSRFPSYVENVILSSDDDFANTRVSLQYYFLDEHKKKFVFGFLKERHSLPMFFISICYLKQTEINGEILFAQLLGLRGEKQSIQEIAKSNHISIVGARNIIKRGITKLQAAELFNPKYWDGYEFFKKDFFEADYEWHKIAINECADFPEFDTNVFISMCNIVNESQSFTFNNHQFVFSEKLISSFDFKAAVVDIENSINSKCKTDTKLPIRYLIEGYWIHSGSFSDSFIKECLVSIIKNGLLLNVDSEDNILFKQNTIDVQDELYAIIEQYGKPMHINDIYSRFKLKYPNHKYTESGQIRSILLLSNRFKAVGRSSTYILDKWNISTMNIADLANAILSESPSPLSLTEVVDIMETQYRFTNVKSLFTILRIDNKGRFLRFKNGLWGLVGKTYDASFIVMDESDNAPRFSFAERTKQFLEFMDTHQYSPQNGGSKEEQALLRWYQNYKWGIVKATDEQRDKFDKEIEKRKEFMMTGQEYVFMNRCAEFKAFVSRDFSIPSKNDDSELYMWFYQNRKAYYDYKDKRKCMFERLIEFLADYGFIIK